MRVKRGAKRTFYHIFVAGFGFCMLYPLLWLVFSSFKSHTEVFSRGGSLLPTEWHFENYAEGWSGFAGVSFSVFFKNSFFIAGVATLGAVISSALVAYGFSRIRFRLRGLWFACMMITMMLPAQILMIPQYILFNQIGWVNTFLPVIVPSFTSVPFFVFLIMQFINGIPRELDESAKIDGCGRGTIFVRIILPLVGPAVATSALFSFMWRWDDFFGALLYLNRPTLYPVSMALRMFSDPAALTNWGAMFAMCTLSLLPVLLIFIFFQRYLVEGISTTGLKG